MNYRWINKNGNLDLIASEDLKVADIPEFDSNWDLICQFAHTFNGYDHWGSFEKCAEIANQRRHDTIEELRSCLFFEARRWRHFGNEPDGNDLIYIRELLTKIQQQLVQ